MATQLNVPNLKDIGGSLNVIGNQNISEKNFPSLQSVGGHMHLAMSGFERLPPQLSLVGGNIYLGSDSPKTLRDDCLAKKVAGIVKGQIYLVGGSVKDSEDGEVVYGEIMPLGK
jgi:hypothetical protein